jgi:hypothetical protein
MLQYNVTLFCIESKFGTVIVAKDVPEKSLYVVIQKFLKYIKTITSYLDFILHYHLQISLLGRAHTDPSDSATFEMRPLSVLLLRCLVPSVFPLEFPQLYQIFTPSTRFSPWGEKEVRRS